MPAAFRVEIPADPLVVRELRARLKAWLERRGLTEEQVADTVLAVSEACNNAIEHGYGGELRDDPHHARAPRRASFTSRSRTTAPGRRCAPTRRAAAGC